jgi:hypothetical protein
MAIPINIKKALDTTRAALPLSSLPFASEIALSNPFPIPKSAKPSSDTMEDIVIQRPYLSAPR